MKNPNTKNKLLIFGLFAALGLNMSSFVKDQGVTSLASKVGIKDLTEYIENNQVVHQNSELKQLNKLSDLGESKKKTFRINGSEVTVIVKKQFYKGEFTSPNQSTSTKSDVMDAFDFSYLDDDKNDTTAKILPTSKFDQMSAAELQRESQDIRAQLIAAQKTYKSSTGEDKEQAKKDIRALKKSAESLRDHINGDRTLYSVEIIREDSGDSDTEAIFCTSCDEALKASKKVSYFIKAKNTADINAVVTDAIKAIRKQNKEIDSERKLAKDRFNDWKSCKSTEDGDKIRGDEEKFDCLSDILQAAVEQTDDRLCDDEDDCESLAASTFSKLKTYLSQGSSRERMNKIDSLLKIFEIDLSDDDYDVYVDSDNPFRREIATLVVTRFQLDKKDDYKKQALNLNNAYKQFNLADPNTYSQYLEAATESQEYFDEYLSMNDFNKLTNDSDSAVRNEQIRMNNAGLNLYCIADSVNNDPRLTQRSSGFSFKVTTYDGRCLSRGVEQSKSLGQILNDLGGSSNLPTEIDSKARTRYGSDLRSSLRSSSNSNTTINNNVATNNSRSRTLNRSNVPTTNTNSRLRQHNGNSVRYNQILPTQRNTSMNRYPVNNNLPHVSSIRNSGRQSTFQNTRTSQYSNRYPVNNLGASGGTLAPSRNLNLRRH